MSRIDNTVQLIGHRPGAGERLTAAVDYLNAPVVIYERPPIIEKLAFVRPLLLPDSRPTAVIWLVYKTKRRVRGHLHRPRHAALLRRYCGAAHSSTSAFSRAQGLPQTTARQRMNETAGASGENASSVAVLCRPCSGYSWTWLHRCIIKVIAMRRRRVKMSTLSRIWVLCRWWKCSSRWWQQIL